MKDNYNPRHTDETIAALREENARKDRLLQWAADKLGPELNTSNYDHELVCELNDNMIEVVIAIRAALASARPAPAQEQGEAIDWEAVGIKFDEFARKSFINRPGEHYELKAAQAGGRMMMHLVRRALLARKPAEERGPEDMIEARVWANGEWRIEAASRGAFKVDPRESFVLVPVVSRAEVEARIAKVE